MGFATGFCFGFLVICVLWIADAIGIESPYRRGFRDGYEAALRKIRRKERALDV